MVHLRHHGFPSPLIDWTRSPYIAAYFAFADAKESEKSGGKVAILVFREWVGQGKAYSNGQARIDSIGPYINTSERHHIQQAEYTFCLKNDSSKVQDGGKDSFASHEEALATGNGNRDVFVKFVLPASERNGVMQMLNLMNINAYTLFRNEEGLCRLLADKYIK
jgi:hypothetical protein